MRTLRYATFVLLAFSALLNPGRLSAGGSFSTEKILPLLRQNPELYAFITSALDLDAGGWAIRIGSTVNERLGGARIAPYDIRAKPKGSPGAWTLLVSIEAKTEFLNAQGVPVELPDAVSIKETLIGVKIVPLQKPKNS